MNPQKHTFFQVVQLLENSAFTFLVARCVYKAAVNIGLAGCRIRVKIKVGYGMTRLLYYGRIWV